MNPTAAHHLMASLIWTIYQRIVKLPQNGSLKGISTLLLPASQQGKLMAEVEEQYLPAVPVPVHSMQSF